MHSIPDIFRSGGEEEFRKAERRCLHEVCELYESFVMATGGGTPCYFDNMDYMNAQGKTLFLNSDIDTLVARLLRKKQQPKQNKERFILWKKEVKHD